jgi:MAF protein
VGSLFYENRLGLSRQETTNHVISFCFLLIFSGSHKMDCEPFRSGLDHGREVSGIISHWIQRFMSRFPVGPVPAWAQDGSTAMPANSHTAHQKVPLVLASTSPYRRSLLERLGVPFVTCAPDVDESPRAGENAEALVRRLAEAKARWAANAYPGHLIVGSDQVACIGGAILGKPGTEERAREQLAMASGRRVTFLTGLCLYNSGRDIAHTSCVPFSVDFRDLSEAEIAAYVARERPLKCAGSFRSEGLGIALFERMRGDDPNALIGLPLIELINLLAREGRSVLLDSP